MIVSVIVCGDVLDVLRGLPDEQFHCCVTSPPYWGLRDYGMAGQIGLEKTPEEYVSRMVEVFREVRRVLREDGTLWLNLGDSYATGGGKVGDCPGGGKQGARYRGDHGRDPKAVGIGPQTQPNRMPLEGLKPKDLVGVPWRVAFALQADGWYLRSDIIWHKPNPMPESVTDRPTKAHEYLFLLAKSERYYYNSEAIQEASVSDHPSGNGFKRDARLSFMDGHGPRGNDEQWKPNGRPVSRHNFARDTKEADVPGATCRQHREDREPTFSTGTRNRRSVWTIATQPYPEAHFATFPEDLVRPCILAGCPPGGRVLDPFAGSGTTLSVAAALQCAGVGIELNPEYCKLAEKRLAQEVLPLEVAQ